METSVKLENYHTHKEINAQPAIWDGWALQLKDIAKHIQDWITARTIDEVWFSGAGTSAFIGEGLAQSLNQSSKIHFRSVASTDFVSAPYLYNSDRNILVVSFGRSGQSSESVAMLEQLDQHYPHYDRLNITCNKDSFLAKCDSPKNAKDGRRLGEQRVINLPVATLDQGFAMTSSYTTMYLTALACFDENPPMEIDAAIQLLSKNAESILTALDDEFSELAKSAPKRCIFLGSGGLLGVARESALKILELTAGQTVTSWDSGLGFRHGPKAIVNEDTLIIGFISNHEYTKKYDLDIAEEIKQQYPNSTVKTIGCLDTNLSFDLAKHEQNSKLYQNDGWMSVLYVLVAQMLSMNWSFNLNLNVDDPFIGQGNLTRVVSAVKIYDYEG